METVSIIITHHSSNPDRSELMKKCLESIYKTVHLPCEIIMVDNGGDIETSKWLLNECEEKRITHYIRNCDNCWFGYGRNQAIKLCEGDYIFFTDNDIIFEEGWLEECLEVLKNTGNKRLVTPLSVDRTHKIERLYVSHNERIGEKEYEINTLAGSNCWGMKREDLDIIGCFENHIIAGTLWCREYTRLGYAVAVLPEPRAKDIGTPRSQYSGYNRKAPIVVKKTLHNGEKIIFENK